MIVPTDVIDIFEHAFYVDYQNRKTDYVEKFIDIRSIFGANQGRVHSRPSHKLAADVFRNEFLMSKNVCLNGRLLTGATLDELLFYAARTSRSTTQPLQSISCAADSGTATIALAAASLTAI